MELPSLKQAEVVEKPIEQPVVPPTTCGPHSPELIYQLLIKEGLNRVAALQQLGSWKAESGLDQCQKRGDSGVAWGLNSWHPGRRADMPWGLEQQVHWAIHIEMPRDCRSCYDQLMAAKTPWEARDAIKRSTRWGLEASRWSYADQFSSIF